MYDRLVMSSLAANVFALSCYYTIMFKDNLGIINDIICKGLLVAYLFWICYFTLYMLGIGGILKDTFFTKKVVIVFYFSQTVLQSHHGNYLNVCNDTMKNDNIHQNNHNSRKEDVPPS